MKVKPHKIKLFFVYVIFALIAFGISFISSSSLWIKECDWGCTTYFFPLSFPLELGVWKPEGLPIPMWYPPRIVWRLTIFGFEIMNISGRVPTELTIESVTITFTWVIFSINLGFVLTWIMILYAIDKRRITKQKGGFALFHEYMKSKKRKTLIRRIFRF